MRSTDAQKRDATRVISARRVMFAALVICALIFGGTLLGAIPGVSGALSTSGDSEASAASTAQVIPRFSQKKPSPTLLNLPPKTTAKRCASAITTAIRPSKMVLATTSANRGYAYEYYQRLAPYAGWDYTYRYLTRSEAIEALRNGEVDIVAGINKTPQLEKEFLFSSADMGLDGNPLYFAVNKNRGDLLAELDQAQEVC